MREVLVKLEALWRIVSGFLPPDRRSRYFDPAEVIEFFERYVPLRDALRAGNPKLFGDLPIRELKSSGTTDYDGRGFIHRQQIEQLLRDMAYVLHVAGKELGAEPPPLTVTREGVFFSGQQFDALRRIAEILAPAKTSIVIVDGYVNEEVLDLLTTKGTDVDVRILTREVSPSLAVAARKFNQQFGRLHIRTSTMFHDRFVVVDDRDYYHFGASIKDAGSRGFMFSKIEEPEVIKPLHSAISEEWRKATPAVQE